MTATAPPVFVPGRHRDEDEDATTAAVRLLRDGWAPSSDGVTAAADARFHAYLRQDPEAAQARELAGQPPTGGDPAGPAPVPAPPRPGRRRGAR